ncbi:DEAD/DEAH box helicase family protein [Sulfurospirillum sp. 1307]
MKLTKEEKRRKINAIPYTLFNYSDKYLTTTENFPLYPIHPKHLIKAVTKKLKYFKIFLSEDTPSLITEMCKTFNQVIYLNQNTSKFKNLIVSPQTGSAKSLSAKLYISLLKKESSLIVVQRVDQAIEFCEQINEWSKNDNYARCFYQISNENNNHHLRIEKEELKNYRCIVITHNMFLNANQNKEVDIYKNFNNKNRDFILIDERIKYHRKYTVSKLQVKEYIKMDQIDSIYEHNDNEILLEAFLNIRLILEFFEGIFDKLKATASSNNSNILFSTYDNTCKIIKYNFKHEYENIENIIQVIKNANIYFVKNPLMPKETAFYNKQSKIKLLTFLKSLQKIVSNDFFYYKNGNDESITTIVPIKNNFGSCVTLDATAKINMFYQIESQYGLKTTKIIKTTPTKIYNNLTIHTAKGFFQGKSTIMKTKRGTKEAKEYLELINSLLAYNDDKILVITSKSFRQTMESLSVNKRISFTHWGDHLGKNNWQDCNRVIVIGWQFYKNLEYYANFISACGRFEDLYQSYRIEGKIMHKFKVTQLADDLVQAVNRSAIRNIIDTKGNCPLSHVYLFYAQKDEYFDVVDIFIDQFKGAKIDKWSPILGDTNNNKSKPYLKIEAIISTIKEELQKSQEVRLTTIINKTGIPKSTISRLINKEEFTTQLSESGLDKGMLDKKSLVFFRSSL